MILDGNETFLLDGGPRDGVPVVLVHGFPLSHEMWAAEVPVLGERYRVIAYDIRGHGLSGVGDGQYTVELFVDDLLALLDHLRIERAVLCGLSMGGYVALRAVERNPERVRALVLCDTRSEADGNEARIQRAQAMRRVLREGVPAFAAGFVKSALAPGTVERRPEVAALVRRIVESTAPAGVRGTLLALAARTDTTPALPGIRVPTLILVGEHDGITPPAASEAMRSRIPGAKMHVIPGAGHLANLENPGEFQRRLLAFLADL